MLNQFKNISMPARCVFVVIFAVVMGYFSYCVIAGHIEEKTEPDEKYCECNNYNCGCCARLEVKHVLDGKLCSNFSYLPDEHGISVTITYNDQAIFNETISAKNPPPICIIKVAEVKMEICLRFYDLDVKNKCFSGCVEFEIFFFNLFPLKHIKLGCFGAVESASHKSFLNEEFISMINVLTGKPKEPEDEPKVALI